MWKLALKNLRGRKAYNSFIIFAVALAVAMVLMTVVMSGGIQNELERNRALMGADLALVPAGTKEKGHVDLHLGPPVRGVTPDGAAGQLKEHPEVEAVTGQKYMGDARMGDVRAALVRFEPATDFVVLPWLEKEHEQNFSERPGGILLGALIAAEKFPGDILELNGESFPVAGRLRKTDTFLDTSIFFPQTGAPVPGSSWLLVRLRKDAFLDFMVNKLETNIAGIEVIARPEMLKTINDQLHGLLRGGGFTLAASLVGVGVFLVTGAMFALMTQERRREFGLLKAMGAGNAFVFRLVIEEAVALAGLGSLLGIAFAAAWLFLAGTGFVFGGASAVPSLGFVVSRMVMTAALTVAVGVLAALYPAWLASVLEPYAAIRSGE